MKKNLVIGAVVVTSLMLSGCATILGGGNSQTLSINSKKALQGTMKYADGKEGEQYFTTPATLTVDRRSKDIILESQDGQFKKKVVKSNMNPWFLGNIIFGGLPGSTTDSIGGAAWKYDDTVNLQSKD